MPRLNKCLYLLLPLCCGFVVFLSTCSAPQAPPVSSVSVAPSLIHVGSTLYAYRGHRMAVNAVAWSPDGTRIAFASFDKTVQVWDVAMGDAISKVVVRPVRPKLAPEARGRSVERNF